MPSVYASWIYNECPALEALERRARGSLLPRWGRVCESDEPEDSGYGDESPGVESRPPAKKKYKKLKKEKVEGWDNPRYQYLSAGSTNPKTAKHPETEQTYLGAVLHLEPYNQSGTDTCPFATAIYRITVADLDPQRLAQVLRSPGYEETEDGHHSFLGLEDRRSNPEKYGPGTCPSVMIIRLPGESIRDWESGPKIRVARSEMIDTQLVGGCANACLNSAGNDIFAAQKAAGRRQKTSDFHQDTNRFISRVFLDLVRLQMSAAKQGHKGVVRLNATSDISWEAVRFPEDPQAVAALLEEVLPSVIRADLKSYWGQIGDAAPGRVRDRMVAALSHRLAGSSVVEAFPDIQFYDYTKNPGRAIKSIRARNGDPVNWPSNYYLIFSLAEDNKAIARRILDMGGTVAAVFNMLNVADAKGDFPKTWYGYPIFDADQHDYRFLDTPGSIAGLRTKGEAKFRETDYGFVIQPDDPGLDQNDPAVIAAREYIEDWERRRREGTVSGQPGQKNAAMAQARRELNLVTYHAAPLESPLPNAPVEESVFDPRSRIYDPYARRRPPARVAPVAKSWWGGF